MKLEDMDLEQRRLLVKILNGLGVAQKVMAHVCDCTIHMMSHDVASLRKQDPEFDDHERPEGPEEVFQAVFGRYAEIARQYEASKIWRKPSNNMEALEREALALIIMEAPLLVALEGALTALSLCRQPVRTTQHSSMMQFFGEVFPDIWQEAGPVHVIDVWYTYLVQATPAPVHDWETLVADVIAFAARREGNSWVRQWTEEQLRTLAEKFLRVLTYPEKFVVERTFRFGTIALSDENIAKEMLIHHVEGKGSPAQIRASALAKMRVLLAGAETVRQVLCGEIMMSPAQVLALDLNMPPAKRPATLDGYLRQEVAVLELSAKARKALEKAEIRTIGNLVLWGATELKAELQKYGFSDCGQRIVNEITQKLQDVGLRLGMNEVGLPALGSFSRKQTA